MTPSKRNSAHFHQPHCMERSFSSFSSSNDNDDDTLVMPPPPEQDDHPILDSLQIVRLFLQSCAQGNYAQAMTFLDACVQVSYPGLPFVKSAEEWYLHATAMAKNGHHYHYWDCVRGAEAPQQGCCSGQVIRRRRRSQQSSSSGGNNNNSSGFIEVFQVAETIAGVPRIVAMYLRKAPSKWMSPKQNTRRRCSKEMLDHRETRCDDEDSVQEYLVREERRGFMLRKGNFAL